MTHPRIDRDTALMLRTGAEPAPPRGFYLITFWLPTLGPAPIAIRQAGQQLLTEHGELDADEQHLILPIWAGTLAEQCGIGTQLLEQHLWRAARHGFWHHADVTDGTVCCWTIPRAVPQIPARIVERRSATFRAAHARFLADHAPDRAGQF